MPPSKRRAEVMEEDTARKRQHIQRNGPEASTTGQGFMTETTAPAQIVDLTSDKADEAKQDLKALTVLHSDFESLRHTITCKICEKLFYEPFVLSCGHTYCYRCLSTWFSSCPNASCPNCRVRIVQPPAPSYVIKEMVGIFAAKVELLPDGETVEDHKIWAKEEAEFLMAERENEHGLFRGKFKKKTLLRPMVDPSDNIARCPRCLWELEDDTCEQCGITFDSDGNELGSDVSDRDSYLDDMEDGDQDLDLEDSDSAWYDGELDETAGSIPHSHGLPHFTAHVSALRANGQPYGNAPWEASHAGSEFWDDSRGVTFMDDSNSEIPSDDDLHDDDEDGSMDSFIVNDDTIDATIDDTAALESNESDVSESDVTIQRQSATQLPWHNRRSAIRRVVLDDDEDDEDEDSQSDSSSPGSDSDSSSDDDEDSEDESSDDDVQDVHGASGDNSNNNDDEDDSHDARDSESDDDSGIRRRPAGSRNMIVHDSDDEDESGPTDYHGNLNIGRQRAERLRLRTSNAQSYIRNLSDQITKNTWSPHGPDTRCVGDADKGLQVERLKRAMEHVQRAQQQQQAAYHPRLAHCLQNQNLSRGPKYDCLGMSRILARQTRSIQQAIAEEGARMTPGVIR